MTATRLFAPGPINGPRLAQIGQAKHVVHGAAFDFSIPLLTDLILRQAAAGIAHFWLFDLGQYQSAYNPHDAIQINRLKNASGVVVLIGRSSQGNLMHEKFAVIDGRLTQHGSANYTQDAERQTNHVILEGGLAVANAFLIHWQATQQAMLARPETIRWGS